LERQARIAELRKKTAEAEAAEAKAKGLESPVAASATSGTETLPEAAADYPAGDRPVLKPGPKLYPDRRVERRKRGFHTGQPTE